MPGEGGLQLALILLLLDRHAEDICSTLQKCDVLLAKFAFGSTVDLENPEWRAIPLQYDVHRPANAVLYDNSGVRNRCSFSDEMI